MAANKLESTKQQIVKIGQTQRDAARKFRDVVKASKSIPALRQEAYDEGVPGVRKELESVFEVEFTLERLIEEAKYALNQLRHLRSVDAGEWTKPWGTS